MFRIASLALFLLLSWISSTTATIFTPITDTNLLQQSACVIYGIIEQASVFSENGHIETRYLVQVKETLKGTGDDLVEIAIPGGRDRNGIVLKIEGAPEFTTKEEVLLFLNPRPDGVYQINQLFLGSFHLQTQDGDTRLSRNLDGVIELPPPSSNQMTLKNRAQRYSRDPDQFMNWIRVNSNHTIEEENYWIESQNQSPAVSAEYTLWGARWREFDNGMQVHWYAHETDQAGWTGGGYAQTQQALDCWNQDQGSNIDYNYFGTTIDSGGLIRSDGRNTILFNDPNDEIEGSYSCNTGGVLGYGGYRSADTHQYKGQSFLTIYEGDIVLQNGAGCYFELNGGSNGAEVLAHELGHTLGFDHSSDQNALMYAYAHGDGRGAQLSADDREGIGYLYQTSPAVPTGLSATKGEHTDRIELSWNSATDATSYRLYRSLEIGTEGNVIYTGDTLTHTDTQATSGAFYYYSIQACHSTCGAISDQESGFRRISRPTSLSSSWNEHYDHIAISWSTVGGALEYKLYRSTDPNQLGSIVYSGNTIQWDDFSATMGTIYYYRATACDNNGCSSPSSQEQGAFSIVAPDTIFASTYTRNDRIEVNWTNTTGATSFHLYRSTLQDQTGEQIYDGAALHFDDFTSLEKQTYYYRVAGCSTGGCGAPGSPSTGAWALPKSTGLTASDGTYSGKVELTWNPTNDTQYYQLFRANSTGAKGTELYRGPTPSFTDLGASPEVTYFYHLTACNGRGCGEQVTDTGFQKVAASEAPAIPTSLTASDGSYQDYIYIIWSGSEGATYYQLFSSQTGWSSSTLLYKGAQTTFRDFTTSSKTIAYKIQGCNTHGCSDLSKENLGHLKETQPITPGPPRVTKGVLSSIFNLLLQ